MTVRAEASAESHAVKTYRYLRLAMVFLVAWLAVAVLHEGLTRDPGCWEASISSYYYTPVRGVFVGVLVAVGVCLIALKGSTETEDVLLNLAGMLALVVPLVPTPALGSCRTGAATDPGAIRENIANNVLALLVVGFAALAWAMGNAWQQRAEHRWSVVSDIGGIAATAILVATAVVFGTSRDFFVRWAHDASAVSMFLCLIVVMGLNALGVGRTRAEPGNTLRAALRTGYAAVGLAMAATLVVVVVLKIVDVRLAHLVLWVEAALVAEFAAFWILQTRELWGEGVRGRPGAAPH
jgi:hypothetical protein